MSTTPSQTLRFRWLDSLLPEVPFDGWTEAAATKAADSAGLSPGEQALAAPNGVTDLIDAFFDQAADTARDTLAAQDMSQLKVPGKVRAGILAWLEALEPHREAVRRAAIKGMLPWSAAPALQRTWKVADMVWDAAGDTATDYNRYSKRGLLAAALPSIVMKWLDHPSDEELGIFIDRRLAQASGIGRNLGRVAKPLLDALPVSRPNRSGNK
ncbi:MAG: COQ9 family protein [Alphaproteobacteria bacterium]|nr:COQ9 family protein [Hyphomonas sp.]MBR9806338.1 COQ9 family protein [Alphaproteobacteria bacterium]